MVERIDGMGDSLEYVISRSGINPDQYRKIHFYDRNQRDSERELVSALNRLSNYPAFDEQSRLVTNLRSDIGGKGDVLYVPKGCPNILPERYPVGESLPREDESYLALAKTDRSDQEFELLILAEGDFKARRIASSKVAKILNLGPSEDVYVTLVPLTPLDFIVEAKRLIDLGQELPDFITRFGGLRRYQEENRKDRESFRGNLTA